MAKIFANFLVAQFTLLSIITAMIFFRLLRGQDEKWMEINSLNENEKLSLERVRQRRRTPFFLSTPLSEQFSNNLTFAAQIKMFFFSSSRSEFIKLN